MIDTDWRQRALSAEREVSGLRAELAAAKEVAAREIAHLRSKIDQLTYDDFPPDNAPVQPNTSGYGYV